MENNKLHSRMSFRMIGAIVLLLAVFGMVVSSLGFLVFSNKIVEEYTATTYRIADTASTLVNGDHLAVYPDGEETEEYNRTREWLDAYCRRMWISLVYVIRVDESDYGRFVSVFNSVNNEVDNSAYTVWECGYRRNTTNDEYREKYRALYEKQSEHETIFRRSTQDGVHPHITSMVPVKNSAGKVEGILCVQRPIREIDNARRPYLITVGIITVIMAAVAALLAAGYLRKQFVKPIRKISEEATRFARENTKGEELGDVSSYEEIYSLSRSIDKMETDMVNYMQNLTTITAEKERIGTELSFAKRIQFSSLPTRFPASPDRTDFDIYASAVPAREVGGDFYSFRMIDDDHLAMWIGDVSDKGVPAALFMMSANIVINIRAGMGGTPAEIMAFVNDNICQHNHANLFVTIWLGIMEFSTGKLTFVNAGHEEPAVYHKGGEFELYKTKHNVAVGVMPDIEYKDFEIRMGKGDKLFIYTDGVPEATDKNDKLFTTDRMLKALNKHRDGKPEEILEGVYESVNEFVGDRAQFDDLTMLGFELKE